MHTASKKQRHHLTSYSSSSSYGALVCEIDFEKAFQQTTPDGAQEYKRYRKGTQTIKRRCLSCLVYLRRK